MDRTLLLVVGALLTVGLVTGAISFVKAGQARRLKERVSAAGALGVAQSAASDLPSIRLKTNENLPLVDRILRFLRYNPDVPQAQIIAWPIVVLGGILISAVVGYYMSRLLPAQIAVPIGLVGGVVAMRTAFGMQHARYVDAIFQQIPDAIGLMVRAVRAGLPVGEAMRSVATELASPLRDEFARMLGDVAIGRPVDQAMMRLYHRTGLTEFSFLAVTLGMQSQTGGNLAETLENLADTVRKRVQLSKRARALAAEARMQAGILMALPFVAVLAMANIQPFYMDNLFGTPTGRKLALIGLGFSLFGFLVIRWMIKRAGTD